MEPLPASSPWKVEILAYPGVNLLNIVGVTQTLAAVEHSEQEISFEIPYTAAPRRYHVQLVSKQGGVLLTSSGISVETAPFPVDRREVLHDLIVPGGQGVKEAALDERILRYLFDSAKAARRVCFVGSGALIGASAGLLDDRRTVTHWNFRLVLERRFPKVRMLHNDLFTKDGKFWSSAGMSASVDVGLAMVEEDCGRTVAMSVARHMVVPVKRGSRQSQLGVALAAQTTADSQFTDLIAWLQANMSSSLTVENLADRVHMSLRNFSRRFREEVGQSPAHFLELLRVESATAMLQQGGVSVAQVADRLGFGDEERMRRAFIRQLGAPPSSFKKPRRISD